MIEAIVIAMQGRVRPASARAGFYLALGGATLLLAACSTGSPTYGTGTPADAQLLEDVTGAISLAPKDRGDINYRPRPGIVMPASKDVLPPPQQDLATADNPKWPESPEARKARVRAEATLNSENPAYDPGIQPRRAVNTKTTGIGASTRWEAQPHDDNPQQNRREFKKRLALTQQGSPTTRHYLSDPPLELRKPAAGAPVGDLGIDEWKKKRDAERAAKTKSLPGKLRESLGL